MALLPSALGFLRSDVSGLRQSQDEDRIRRVAKRTGYELQKTIAFSDRTDEPIRRLRVVVDRLHIDAVIVPGTEHFDNRQVPAALLEVAAVITPTRVYPRTAPKDSEQ